MSYPKYSSFFRDAFECNKLIDKANQNMDADVDSLFRVMKVMEELGEATQELVAIYGQNPAKVRAVNYGKLYSELADVALTAVCAIQHFTQDEDRTMACLEAKAQAAREKLWRAMQ